MRSFRYLVNFVYIGLLSNCLEFAYLDAIFFNTKAFVNEFRIELSNIFNITLSSQFKFSSDNNLTNFDNFINDCPPHLASYDCSDIVLHESTLASKKYALFIFELMQGNVFPEIPLRSSVDPILRVSDESQRLNNLFPLTQHKIAFPISTQAGGGAGFGLQVYCDGDFILTAGVGGGGGFQGRDLNNITTESFGGGGGGGLQFNVSALCGNMVHFSDTKLQAICDKMILHETVIGSIGGGGGCGSRKSGEEDQGSDRSEEDSPMQCGWQRYSDVSAEEKVGRDIQEDAGALAVLLRRRLSQCAEVILARILYFQV